MSDVVSRHEFAQESLHTKELLNKIELRLNDGSNTFHRLDVRQSTLDAALTHVQGQVTCVDHELTNLLDGAPGKNPLLTRITLLETHMDGLGTLPSSMRELDKSITALLTRFDLLERVAAKNSTWWMTILTRILFPLTLLIGGYLAHAWVDLHDVQLQQKQTPAQQTQP